MLINTHELSAKASELQAQAAAIDGEARGILLAMKEFRKWVDGAKENATEVHKAVKEKLDEDHGTLLDKMNQMAARFDELIERIEGGKTNG